MNELQVWKAWLLTFTDDWRTKDQAERGASTVELVILTALFAAGAIAIAIIIINKFTGKANSIPTG